MIIERTEPWLTEDANRLLAEIVAKGRNLHVFEYGAGASTIWFTNQSAVNSIVSVESDINWAKAVIDRVNGSKLVILQRKIPYNKSIDMFNMFDIILVDGRNRVKCITSAIPHLKPGGVLILDNSERSYYQPGIDLMKGWKRIDTYQPQLDKYGFTYPNWTTSFFVKPR
jgi:predicted O-methyltransferase YrrM